MNKSKVSCFFLVAISIFSWVACQKKEIKDFVPVIQNGIQINTVPMGNKWKAADGYIFCSGKGDDFDNMMYSSFYVNDNDFHVKMKISFDTIGETTSIFLFFNNHFGFDSDDKGPGTKERLFMYTPKYDSLLYFQPSAEMFSPNVPFQFEVIRTGDSISFLIDQHLVTKQSTDFFSGPLRGSMGIRPWRNRIKIYDWAISGQTEPFPDIDYVFKNGEGEYACFRIPAIIQAKNGDLLAFAEGRKNSCRDNYDVDMVMKKSTDNGQTWGPLVLIWNDSTNTCGNPAPIVDLETGRVLLFVNWQLGSDRIEAIKSRTSTDTKRMFLFTSNDNGDSWSEKREMTSQMKLPGWDSFVAGPGSGLQMRNPTYKNRMVLPCHFSTIENGKIEIKSNLIYSDDGGDNWVIGGISPETDNNECEVAEISNGGLMVNMRKASKRISARSVAYSFDGGATLENQHFDDELIGPTCMASLDNYVAENGKLVCLFANPNHQFSRENLTIQRSFDDGETWEKFQTVFKGYSGYSDLVPMQNGQVGIIFECGKIRYSDGLAFRSYDWE
ncbi:MAG: sialidase family protein [Saprospiraceae bacterium]